MLCSEIDGVGGAGVVVWLQWCMAMRGFLALELGCSAMTNCRTQPQFRSSPILPYGRRQGPGWQWSCSRGQGTPQNEGNHSAALPRRSEHLLGLERWGMMGELHRILVIHIESSLRVFFFWSPFRVAFFFDSGISFAFQLYGLRILESMIHACTDWRRVAC